jgi:nucleotide-binding universal stress UspA family protein
MSTDLSSPKTGTLEAPVAPAGIHLQRILVPVDFSDCGRKAIQYGIPLARQYGGKLLLLYVVQDPYPVTEFGGIALAQMEADLSANAVTELDKFANQEVRPHVPADTRVVFGSPETQIVDVARLEAVDLIVISTHGRTGLEHMFLGSVVENVVRHAPCPVLVVRQKEHEFVDSPVPGDGLWSNGSPSEAS